MGAQQSTPAVAVPSSVSTTTPVVEAKPACPVGYKSEKKEGTDVAAAKSACPLGYGKDKTESAKKDDCNSCKKDEAVKDAAPAGCPVKTTAAPKSEAPHGEGCPVRTKDGKYKNPNVYNVYNQKIDPTNQMPATANQLPSAEQAVPLSTNRESSSIPKGGTESTWLYPSPQMFWNALVRKDKTEGVIEDDIESVVRIHNNMNESTWKQILEWEKLHPVEAEGKEPRLLRFLGRPDELSPKARLKALFGHAEPFDRHDWIVDRGGEEVRYIIDYYHDEFGAKLDQNPANIHDLSSIKSIKTDVRPALDSVGSVVDRVFKMPVAQATGKTDFKELAFFAEKKTVVAELKQAEQMQRTWQVIKETCEADKNRLMNCKTDKECENASIALQRCTAGVVCPTIAIDFDKCLQAQPFDNEKTDRVYTTMVKCLELFEMDSKKAFSKK